MLRSTLSFGLRLRALTAATLALPSLVACAPQSQYRYTALVPSVRPLAWDGRTGKGGSLRLEGDFTSSHINQNEFPQLHDTALNVASTEVSGLAALSIVDQVEIGIRGSYSSYAWSTPSAVGTEPLPNRPTLWGIGPEVRATIPIDREKHFAIGLGLSYLHYQVPYASWVLTGPNANPPTNPCTPGALCTVDPSTIPGTSHYQFQNETSETHWAVNMGVYPSYAFGSHGQYGRVFGILGAHTGFTNDGFTNTQQSGSTLSSGIVWLAGGGYGIEFAPVHVSVLGYQPFNGSSSGVSYGPGVMLTFGVDVRLWGEDEEERRRRLAPAPSENPPPPPPAVVVVPMAPPEPAPPPPPPVPAPLPPAPPPGE